MSPCEIRQNKQETVVFKNRNFNLRDDKIMISGKMIKGNSVLFVQFVRIVLLNQCQNKRFEKKNTLRSIIYDLRMFKNSCD